MVTSEFGAVVADLDYPMTVVTCCLEGQPSGCLVGFASQCSIHPPRVSVWISQANHTHDIALRCSHLGVHWLSAADRPLAELFGAVTGDDADKFHRCRWRPAAGGVPVLEDCGRWFVGRVLEKRFDGDHTGFLLEPVEDHAADRWPGQLGYQAVKDLEPGHDP